MKAKLSLGGSFQITNNIFKVSSGNKSYYTNELRYYFTYLILFNWIVTPNQLNSIFKVIINDYFQWKTPKLDEEIKREKYWIIKFPTNKGKKYYQ